MEITIIYIAIFGANNRYAWSCTTIEDGEIDKVHGIATNELRAILWAICTCIGRVSKRTPVIIRSRERNVQQLGKNWIDTWKRQGYATEPDAQLIETFLDNIAEYNISWFAPQYPDALDKTILMEAKQYYASEEEISPEEIDAIQQQIDTLATNNTKQEESVSPDTFTSVDTKPPIPIEATKATNGPVEDIPPTENTPQQHMHHVIDCVSNIQVTENTPPQEKSIDQHAEFAYIDEETEELLAKIFETPEPTESITKISKPQFIRILAYIDVQRNQHLCVWAFVLIDRNSGVALCKSDGYTHGSWHRTFIQGCTELLETVQDASLPMEIRSRHKELADVVELARYLSKKNRLPADVTSTWANQLPFLGKFTTILETRNIETRCYTDMDQGILDAMQLSSSGVQSLNEGRSPKNSQRRRFYPLDKLFE